MLLVHDLISPNLIGLWLWRNDEALWSMTEKCCSVGDRIPLISECLKVWNRAHLRITSYGKAAPVSAPVCAPTITSHQQSLLLPALLLSLLLLLPAVPKLKTAGWNTRLMKPCLELFVLFFLCLFFLLHNHILIAWYWEFKVQLQQEIWLLNSHRHETV